MLTLPSFSVIVAIFVFSHGFACALVIAGSYVADSWGGHFLAK
jgi:hypothetical protein